MQTKRLHLIHDELAKDISDNFTALRDAALNSDNSPEEARPPCVFRSRNAVSRWLPPDCIVTSLWLAQRDAAPCLGDGAGGAESKIDCQLDTTRRTPDVEHANVNVVSDMACETIADAAHEEQAHRDPHASKRLASEMLSHDDEAVPGQMGPSKQAKAQHEIIAAQQQMQPHSDKTAELPKQRAALPPELQVSVDDEKLLKASENRVSKFSASCTVEPWLSKHCSMFGFDFVRRAVKERIQSLQAQPP